MAELPASSSPAPATSAIPTAIFNASSRRPSSGIESSYCRDQVAWWPRAQAVHSPAQRPQGPDKPWRCRLVRPCLSRYCRLETSGSKSPKESAMAINVGRLDHYNVSTRNLGATVRFYEDVLGFVNGPRPPFDFPGAWLYSEGHPVLHLNDISPTDTPQRPDSGVIDHVAFGSRGFEAMKQLLAQKGVEFRVNVVPNSTRRQIFLTDPNNVLLELNFDVAAEQAGR